MEPTSPHYAPPAPCAAAPRDRRTPATRVGDNLVRHYGKRNFYSVQQVRQANRRCDISLNLGCWSHALFNTHGDFDRLHRAVGEACDYVAMKRAMLESLAEGDATSWFDFDVDLSWLEFPDIDWSIFDTFD